MSLTTAAVEGSGDVALLHDLLQKREYHLAELIDEVVYAEQERFKAAQEAQSVRELAAHLENAFDKLLQYHITMHKEVLLPALAASADGASTAAFSSPMENISASGVRRDGADPDASANDFLNELLAEPQISQETKRLLQAVMHQRRSRSESAALERAPASAAQAKASSMHTVQRATHRAIVVSDSLLQNQETLARLLQSIRDQAEEVLGSWSGLARKGITQRRASDASAASASSSVAPFRMENLHQHSDRAREIEEALRRVEAERDALLQQLRDRDRATPTASAAAEKEKEAWAKERVHLKQELAFAQQRALEEQARNRELKKQVTRLEQVAAAPSTPTKPPTPAAAAAAPCTACSETRAEMQRKAAAYDTAKSAWKAEERRLHKEIAELKERAADEAVRRTTAPPVSSSAAALPSAASVPTRYPAGPSSERKIGQLEATVASMKADLQIMEMRMAIVQDEREAERRRILTAHEQERERLRRERDECQRIIDSMSHELQGLSRATRVPPAIASATA